MKRADELRAKLESLKRKREEDVEIKRLERQIRGEEFSQTTGGKIFNKIGDFGMSMGKGLKNVGKAIATPPKTTGKQVKRKTFQNQMNGETKRFFILTMKL